MKIGDKVKIIKNFKSGYKSALSWNSQMDETINMEGIIRKIYKVNEEERIEVVFNIYFDSERNYWTYLKESLQLIEEEFPEKWCIKPTNKKEANLVGEYFHKILKSNSYRDANLYFKHSHNKLDEPLIKGANLSFLESRMREGFTEITFEQFEKKFLKQEETNKMKTTRKKLLSILGKDSCSEFNTFIELELKQNYKLQDDIEFYLSQESLNNLPRANDKQKELLKSIGLIKELDLFSIKTYEEVCKALNEEKVDSCILNGGSRKVNHKRLVALAKLDQIERLFNQDWKKNWKDSDQKKFYPYFEYKLGGWVLHSVDCHFSYSYGRVAYFKDEKTAKYVGETFIDIYKDILE